MLHRRQSKFSSLFGHLPWVRVVFFAILGCPLCGCAALTNPTADGVPVRLLPPELLALSKTPEQTIPLSLLGQPEPSAYQLAAGDILAVYIEGFLGDRNVPPPLHVAPRVRVKDQLQLPPAMGYPVPVQTDGTIVLPSVSPLAVAGLTVADAREAIRKVYLDKKLLRPENERVVVGLLEERRQHVVVFRQEATVSGIDPAGTFAINRRGTGQMVDLPGYENDVLHALAQTGGLPGLDAYNEVIIFKNAFHDEQGRELLLKQWQAPPGAAPPRPDAMPCVQVVHIPLRTLAGHPTPMRPQDVELHTGDVVFLEARDREVFYTGGLLPPGVFVLPRDRDLDVVEAVALVRGPLFNGAFGGSNLSGAIVNPGIGNPSPSLLSVVRRTPDNRQVVIAVNLRQAMRDARERLVLKPGDVLLLQETPCEALTRYATQTFFNFNLLWVPLRGKALNGVMDISAPDRLPGRAEQITLPP
jgi:protein involved in polysaccharide export with SLBB domain